jgi:hypothetical protein
MVTPLPPPSPLSPFEIIPLTGARACDEEENEGENIRSFFGGAGGKPKRKKRTEFFVKRKMKHLEQFSDLTTTTTAAQRAMASQK